jgi:amidohydrolase
MAIKIKQQITTKLLNNNNNIKITTMNPKTLTTTTTTKLWSQPKPDFKQKLLEYRHDLHKHPEIAFEEHRTAQVIAERCEKLGLKVKRNIGITGVVATLVGEQQQSFSSSSSSPKRTVGLRADIDALPMTDEGNVPWKSINAGRAHTCGHDGHTTMLLGAAEVLTSIKSKFSGTIHFIFQPAEEGKGGALRMMEDGLFTEFPCDRIFAMHNWPSLATGVVDVQSGPRMASADNFELHIRAKGGHAAMPHHTPDPIVAASHMVLALQTLASRWTDPVDPIVVSICQFHGGSANNVIPSGVRLGGTVRCFSKELREALPGKMKEIISSVAATFGVSASLEFDLDGFAPTVNSPEATEIARRAAMKTVGVHNVSHKCKPSMGAEDFGKMLESRPGCYVWFGAGINHAGLHEATFDFNDDLLIPGVELFANMALESLSTPVVSTTSTTMEER